MGQGKEKSIKLNMILNGIKGLMGIIFPFISFPYVAKILSVDGLGAFNFASSIVSYITLLAALGFAMYATREGAFIRDDKERFSKFASEIYTLNMLSTLLAYGVLFVLLCAVPKFRDYSDIIMILSLGVFFQTFGCEWVYSVYEEYAYITVRSIALQILSLLMLFLLVKTPNDLYRYAWVSVAAAVVGNITNRLLARKYGRIGLTAKIDWKRHLKPILILFAMNATVAIYVNSDITLLGLLCDDYTVGIYSVSVKIYTIIKTLLSAVVAVAIPRLAVLIGGERRDEFCHTASDIYRTLITVVFPAIVGIVLLRREIVLIISDVAYMEATPSLAILAVTLFFCLGAGFWSQAILIPLKKEKVVLQATIISAAINIVLNICLIPLWGEIAAALTTLAAEVAAFLLCAHAAKKEVKLSGIIPTGIKSAGGCLLLCVYVLLIKRLDLQLIPFVLVAIGGSVMIYAISQLLLKNDAVYGIVANLKRKANR